MNKKIIKEIAKTIAFELMYENQDSKTINDDSLEKDCYLAVADIKGDIKYETEKILKERGFKIRCD